MATKLANIIIFTNSLGFGISLEQLFKILLGDDTIIKDDIDEGIKRLTKHDIIKFDGKLYSPLTS